MYTFGAMSSLLTKQEPEKPSLPLEVVDISPFHSSKENELTPAQQNVIETIHRSFSTLGFLLIKGHNIPSHLLEKTFSTSKSFFEYSTKPDPRNETIIRSSVPRGFAPLNSENFASLIGEIRPNDLVSKYRIGPEYHHITPKTSISIRDYLKKPKKYNKKPSPTASPKINSNVSGDVEEKNPELLRYYSTKASRSLLYPNIWPSPKHFPSFQSDILTIYDYFYKTSLILCRIFSFIFHKKPDYFLSKFTRHTSILSSNYYPILSNSQNGTNCSQKSTKKT